MLGQHVEARLRERATTGRDNGRSACCCRPLLNGNASTTRMPRASNDASAPASSARATPRRRHAGAMTKQTMTAAGFGRRLRARLRESPCAPCSAAVSCSGCALSQPTTSSPGIREEAVHFGGLDARRHRRAVRVAVEALPVDRFGHMVEMAIALRPIRVVGKRRPVLVVEEAQEVVAARRRQAFDADPSSSACLVRARLRTARISGPP